MCYVTWFSRQNHFELIVATKNNQATGLLFFDDGESLGKIAWIFMVSDTSLMILF